MSTATTTSTSRLAHAVRAVLVERVVLLMILLAAVLVTMWSLDAAGKMSGSYNSDYLAGSLIDFVPMAMLGMAQLTVITSGRGGIDLSVGAIVSLVNVTFGYTYGPWGLPLGLCIALALAAGAVLGALNGFLVAYCGFPGLIVTLATYYAYSSIALAISGSNPIDSPRIADLARTARSVQLPLIGQWLPLVPLGLFLFLLPTTVVMYFVLNRSPYGRRLFAIGTNDVAARWAGIPVRSVRAWAYTISGAICGLVAVVTVGQFASARPDAGVSGNGMLLPSITIAVLGGVAITGGAARLAGVLLAALLVIWLDAGLLLLLPGSLGPEVELLTLGAILIGAALLTGYATRRYRLLT